MFGTHAPRLAHKDFVGANVVVGALHNVNELRKVVVAHLKEAVVILFPSLQVALYRQEHFANGIGFRINPHLHEFVFFGFGIHEDNENGSATCVVVAVDITTIVVANGDFNDFPLLHGRDKFVSDRTFIVRRWLGKLWKAAVAEDFGVSPRLVGIVGLDHLSAALLRVAVIGSTEVRQVVSYQGVVGIAQFHLCWLLVGIAVVVVGCGGVAARGFARSSQAKATLARIALAGIVRGVASTIGARGTSMRLFVGRDHGRSFVRSFGLLFSVFGLGFDLLVYWSSNYADSQYV